MVNANFVKVLSGVDKTLAPEPAINWTAPVLALITENCKPDFNPIGNVILIVLVELNATVWLWYVSSTVKLEVFIIGGVGSHLNGPPTINYNFHLFPNLYQLFH